MHCAHCGAAFDVCRCGVRTFRERAIAGCAFVGGDPHALRAVESVLRERGIVGSRERLRAYREERDFARAGAESFGAVFSVTVARPDGRKRRRKVYAKAVVTGFGRDGTAAAIAEQVDRLRLLAEWGIRVPRVYGCGEGTIYEEYVAGSDADSMLRPGGPGTMRRTRKNALIGELAKIAATLDAHGVSALDFLRDLRIDRSGRPFYVDAGADLGEVRKRASPSPGMPARRTLCNAFRGEDRRAAERAYLRHYGRMVALSEPGGA